MEHIGKMDRRARAKQFAPYEALGSCEHILSRAGYRRNARREVSSERAEEIDEVLRTLTPGELLRIVYYDGEDYVCVRGQASRLDTIEGTLSLGGKTVALADIFICERI